ncbi:MAG: glutamate--tRNA ligase [Bacteroidetes bacterium]|nr:glutamate--tRNA ligase [Bacteroidota bacterium]
MRVRFAPSPTGYLHIGGLRTALYNFLLARKHGGTFVLRVEDTDRTRFVEDAEADILSSLTWAGIQFDEGPGLNGGYGPYRQSERSTRYAEVANHLIEHEKAYIAFDSSEEIDALKERLRTPENPSPRYDHETRLSMSNSLTMSSEDVARKVAAGEEYVVRLLVTPGSQIKFTDVIRGEVEFDSATVDDQVLVKSDGLPTYHLANIVDDHDMAITHVIRGEEWLPSTPKHVLLYQAMGWDVPQMAHLPLILSPTGGKLSKRNADKQGIPVSVSQYREAGYEAHALVNFLAMLGWNPGDDREVFSMEELIEAFSLERVGQSGVQFDLQKLEWFNEHWLRSRSDSDIADELETSIQDTFSDVSREHLVEAVALMKDRLSFASDLLEAEYLFRRPSSYDEKSVAKRWKDDSPVVLAAFADSLESVDEWTLDKLEEALQTFVEIHEMGMGKIMFPIRLALSGQPSGPGLYEMMALFGKDETIARFRACIDALA